MGGGGAGSEQFSTSPMDVSDEELKAMLLPTTASAPAAVTAPAAATAPAAEVEVEAGAEAETEATAAAVPAAAAPAAAAPPAAVTAPAAEVDSEVEAGAEAETEAAAKAAAAAKTVAAAAETTVVTVAVEPTFTLEEFCKDGDHVVHKISPLSNTSETSGVFAVKELPQGCIIPSPPRSRELKQSQKKTTRAAAKELVGHNFITVRIGCEEETFDTSELLNVPNFANSCLPAPYNEPNCEWTVVKVKLEDGSVVAGLGLHTTASTAAGTELLLGNGGGGVLASKRNPFQPSIPLRESTVEGTCPICSREGLCG